MKPPDAATLHAVVEATWPPARRWQQDGWMIRDGAGGGKRVSAATAAAEGDLPDVAAAERAMAALGQPALFMLRDGEAALDTALDARGYVAVDPVTVYLCQTATLAAVQPPRMAAFTLYPPLQIMRDLWAQGGIGSGRLAVMDRCAGAKTTVLGRINDRAAGTAYVAVHDGIGMLHALEVAPGQRRQGVGVAIMGKAAHWAQDQGAAWFAVLVTEANAAANMLYRGLHMRPVAQYHYRVNPAETEKAER